MGVGSLLRPWDRHARLVVRGAVLRRDHDRGRDPRPIFESPLPAWNPLHWSVRDFTAIFHDLVGHGALRGADSSEQWSTSWIASFLSLSHRLSDGVLRDPGGAGRRKVMFLVLLIAPFWVSYMMRMLAWIDLLADQTAT